MKPRELLSDAEIQKVEAKIAGAEAKTSAEIRVAIAKNAWLGVQRRARKLFLQQQMHLTEARNGVLILLVSGSRELVVFGDVGIHEKAGQELWEAACAAMVEELHDGRVCEALCLGVRMVGEALAEHFPRAEGDHNELSNAIIFAS